MFHLSNSWDTERGQGWRGTGLETSLSGRPPVIYFLSVSLSRVHISTSLKSHQLVTRKWMKAAGLGDQVFIAKPLGITSVVSSGCNGKPLTESSLGEERAYFTLRFRVNIYHKGQQGFRAESCQGNAPTGMPTGQPALGSSSVEVPSSP